MYGALIGDACGVPYEFKSKDMIPKYDEIDMIPPENFKRSWSSIPVGTYSDDGAQILCLLEVLLEHNEVDTTVLRETLQDWMYKGHMSVDNLTFDVGNQTSAALRKSANVDGLNNEQFNGNGSLMRTLPVALCGKSEKEVADNAYIQSAVTHPHEISRTCCELYALTAYYMLQGNDVTESVNLAFLYVNENSKSDYQSSVLTDIVTFGEIGYFTGTGYVVDSFWSSLKAVQDGTSYEDVIKRAIQYGNDTDTTACIAGGLAGIKFGLGDIPLDWFSALRGKDLITPLTNKLFLRK